MENSLYCTSKRETATFKRPGNRGIELFGVESGLQPLIIHNIATGWHSIPEQNKYVCINFVCINLFIIPRGSTDYILKENDHDIIVVCQFGSSSVEAAVTIDMILNLPLANYRCYATINYAPSLMNI